MFTSLIELEDLLKLQQTSSAIIIDCRYVMAKPQEGLAHYLSAHIPGAIYLSLDHDLSDLSLTQQGRHPLPNPHKLQALFSKAGIQKTSQVVAYDDSDGSFASRLWWLLNYAGHSSVAVLNGGFNAWKTSPLGLALRAGAETNSPTEFELNLKNTLLVEISEVLDSPLLIDSRAPERYSGKIEPLDPVAGHIRGAINRPYQKNLTSDGKFNNRESLRREFEELFKNQNSSLATFYCGSGVTACHNILAAVYAGFSPSRLYAGSWSEWCRHPELPRVEP